MAALFQLDPKVGRLWLFSFALKHYFDCLQDDIDVGLNIDFI